MLRTTTCLRNLALHKYEGAVSEQRCGKVAWASVNSTSQTRIRAEIAPLITVPIAHDSKGHEGRIYF